MQQHGLVHGGSLNDSAYHGRVESGPCSTSSRCAVGQYDNDVKYGYASAGQTCEVFLSGYGPECAGAAWTEQFTSLWHKNKAHYWCG